MSTLIGIDLGSDRIGIAKADEELKVALPSGVIRLSKGESPVKKTLEAINDLKVSHIAVGLPLHMNGKESIMSRKARAFAQKLQENCSAEVHLIDERMTSKESSRRLSEGGISQKAQRGELDAHAAMLILQVLCQNLT